MMIVKSWLRNRWLRSLLGLVAGATAGLAVYQGSQLTGRSLFIVCGAVAGLVAALVVHGINQTIRLTDITVSVPQFSEMHFAVTKDSQLVAWKLFVEAVTRISTQPLAADGGLIREAMTSLYSLFAITRDVLKQTQPSRLTGNDPTVEHLAIAMLNTELRPFLTRWHPALLSWERGHPGQDEASWPENSQCRVEMDQMRRRLIAYVLGFGKLARLPNAQQIVDGTLGQEFANATKVPVQDGTKSGI
jgi:hypothetical protein